MKYMEIKRELNGTTLNLSIVGRLDTTTAPTLEESLKELEKGEVKELILNFKELDYISSAGLRVLLAAQKTMNNHGTMKIVNVCPEVMEIFEVTGFTDILTIA